MAALINMENMKYVMKCLKIKKRNKHFQLNIARLNYL